MLERMFHFALVNSSTCTPKSITTTIQCDFPYKQHILRAHAVHGPLHTAQAVLYHIYNKRRS